MEYKTEKIEKKKQVNYPQKFRQAWKKDPKLKDWLRELLATPEKAYCIYCKCELISKYCDLLNHATTKKHLKASILCQQQQLTDSLDMIKDVAHEMDQNIEYSSDQIEIEAIGAIKVGSALKRERKALDYVTEISVDDYVEPAQIDEDEEEFAEILNMADEIETAELTLQEKRIKAEIEYFQQKTQYFARLTENTRIHKTLMLLQARKINLEIKKIQDGL